MFRQARISDHSKRRGREAAPAIRLVGLAALVVGLLTGPSHADVAPLEPVTLANSDYVTSGGEVTVIGYNDMHEMLSALGDAYHTLHPTVTFRLILEGTRTAPAPLADGRSAFAPMGAEFSDAELARYRTKVNADPMLFRVAHASLDPHARSGPLGIFVQADNPVSSLTMDQLARIFGQVPASERIQDWRQLGGAPGPIHILGLHQETALGLFMRKQALGGRPFAAAFFGSAQSTDVIKQVGLDPQAIGFASVNLATSDVKSLALARQNGQSPISASRETVQAGAYPLDRHLLICARRLPGQALDAFVHDYLDFVLSQQGQGIIASGKLGYLPLNPAEIATERAKLNEH